MADKQPIGEVTQLIERWLELEANGLKISLEELCQKSPDLIDDVRQELSSIRKMDELMQAPDNSVSTELGTRTGEANCKNSYVLEKLLGYGGCSEVYLAQDTELGRPVAVKFLRPDTVNVARLQQRLKQEAEITSQLNHPGIVAIHASGEVNGVPFYSMQYVEGESLSQVLRTCHDSNLEESGFLSLSMRKLLKHFVDVCQTIAFAHERNIIHRDLKPANIVTGQFGETYVIDWGLARRIDDEEINLLDDGQPSTADSRLTQQGHTLGTPAFMSPEQVTGDNIGKPSDVFNLGATLYAILVGQSPYHSDSVVENLKNAQTATFIKPHVVNSKIPVGLSAICTKAMSAKPGDRYASAADLADDVECFLADQPISALPTPVSDTIRRWLYKHRTAVTTLATTGLVGLILLAIGNSMLLKSNRDLIRSEKKATANEARATANEKKARANEAKAVASEAKARQRLYSQLIALANSEIENNNIVRAEEILEQCPPENRQWEWMLLKNMVDRNKPLVSLEFPGDQIRALALDETGIRLAAGDSNGNVRIWSTDSWKLLHQMNAGISIRQMAFLPGTDAMVAVGGRLSRRPGGRISLIETSKRRYSIRKKLDAAQLVTSLAIAPDGNSFVTGEMTNDSQGRIAIYDTASLNQLDAWNAHTDSVNAVMVDDETNRITACGADGMITRWTYDGKELTSQPVIRESLLSIDHRSQFVSTTGSNSIVQIWELNGDRSLEPLHAFAGHSDQVLDSSISPDLKFVATASKDRDIHIWNLETGRKSETIKRHSSHVRCVQFHPTKPYLFSGGEDRIVHVWDYGRLSKLKPTGLSVGFAKAFADTMLSADKKTLSFWNVEGPEKPILRVTDHPVEIGGIASGNRLVATFYTEGFARLWDAETGNKIGEFGNRDLGRTFAASLFDNDGTLCLLHSSGSVEIIDVKNNTVTEIQTEGTPFRLATDDQKQVLAVGTKNGTLELFDLAKNEKIGVIPVSKTQVLAVSIRPHHGQVAVASSDGSITVWDIETQEQACRMQSGSSWLNCLAYTPDGQRIVSGNEHTLNCWDATDGREIVSITMSHCVNELAFNRDGTLLAIASCAPDGVPKSYGLPDIRIMRAGPIQGDSQPGN